MFDVTNETAKKVLDNALPAYCEWLNSYGDGDPDCQYDPLAFTYDRDNDRWGSTHLNAIIATDDPTLYVFSVCVGDEGGPATLYVWANDDNTIVQIVQSFDGCTGTVASTEYRNRRNEFVVHVYKEADNG